MNEETIQMALDPMGLRANAVVDLLREKKMPEFQDDYSQAVFATLIAGMVKPFLPTLQPVSQEGNVVHMEMR